VEAHDPPQKAQIDLLARRQIEGEILKPVYEVLKEKFGEETAKETIGLAIKRAARESGRAMASRLGGGTLAGFVALQPLWRQGDALTVKVLADEVDRYDYDVIRCAYAEMYRRIGLGDLGFLLSCGRDEAFIEGFAPKVSLKRTKTLMEGDSVCDFRYRTEKPAKEGP
jgi:hypothetical protein